MINLGGCPQNPANTAAVLVHYLTFGQLPAVDQYNRPLFAYGRIIHDQCERRAHYDAGRYVQEWGDEGHRKGLVLVQNGLQGPTGDLQLSIGTLERRYELAGEVRSRVPGLRFSPLLGHALTFLRPPAFSSRIRRGCNRRPDWNGRDRRGRRRHHRAWNRQRGAGPDADSLRHSTLRRQTVGPKRKAKPRRRIWHAS